MWNDERFRRLSAPPPCGQSLWQRLLTGPELSNIPGLFMAWEAGLAQSLGWPLGTPLDPSAKDRVTLPERISDPSGKGDQILPGRLPTTFREAWSELEIEGMATADWTVGLVWIPKAIEHNQPESPNVVRGWRTTWNELPECAVKCQAYQELGAFLAKVGGSFASAFAEGCADPSPKGGRILRQRVIEKTRHPLANQEQEQEQEQEKKNPLPPGVMGLEKPSVKPESRNPIEPGLVDLPATIPTRRLDRGVANGEMPDWQVAYAAGISRGSGGPFTCGFSKFEAATMIRVVESHCPDRSRMVAWVGETAERFARAVKAKPAIWSSYSPNGMERWFNAGCPTEGAPSGIHVRGTPHPVDDLEESEPEEIPSPEEIKRRAREYGRIALVNGGGVDE
jgi:hypothetical protein